MRQSEGGEGTASEEETVSTLNQHGYIALFINFVKEKKPMKTKAVMLLAVMSLLPVVVHVSLAGGPKGLEWDANVESDLAGYYLHESTVSNGQVLTTYMVSVPAPLTSFTFPAGHAEGRFYWKLTAYDLSGNQSGFSNEVTAVFDWTAPAPPTGCTTVF